MNAEYRQQLLALQARIKALIADAETLLVGPADDDILLRVSKQLTELRETLAEIEEKLNRPAR